MQCHRLKGADLWLQKTSTVSAHWNKALSFASVTAGVEKTSGIAHSSAWSEPRCGLSWLSIFQKKKGNEWKNSNVQLTDIGKLFDKSMDCLRSRQLYICIALHRISVVLANLKSCYIRLVDISAWSFDWLIVGWGHCKNDRLPCMFKLPNQGCRCYCECVK